MNAYKDINFAVQMAHEKHWFRFGLTEEGYSLWGVSKDQIITFQDIDNLEAVKIVVFSPWDKLPDLQCKLIDTI